MTGEEARNRAVVMRHFLEACGEHRFEVWDEIMHPDYFIHHPWCRPGRDNYVENSRKYWSALTRPRYEFPHVIARGDLVMVHYVERATVLKPLFGEASVGRDYEKKGFALYRLEDGLMREGWNQEDDLGFIRQLGIEGEYSL